MKRKNQKAMFAKMKSTRTRPEIDRTKYHLEVNAGIPFVGSIRAGVERERTRGVLKDGSILKQDGKGKLRLYKQTV